MHLKIFSLTKYREVLVKYSRLIIHAGMLILNLTLVMGMTDRFLFQIINSLILRILGGGGGYA